MGCGRWKIPTISDGAFKSNQINTQDTPNSDCNAISDNNSVSSVSFSPDGKTIVSVGINDSAGLTNLSKSPASVFR